MNTRTAVAAVALTLAGVGSLALATHHDLSPEPTYTFTVVGGNASITLSGNQLDALAPCATEDSTNCYWDAITSGNGQGYSFVDIEGIAYRA